MPDPCWDAAAWASARPLSRGAVLGIGLQVWQWGEALCLREAGVADFYIDGAAIHCHLQNPEYEYIVEIRLLGPVLSFWLEWQGIPNLHAAAAVVAGQAHLFLATNGGGKSSLVAGLVGAGATLLSDDIVPLRQGGGGTIWAEPGYPRMRFWPDAARHFVGDPERFPIVHPRYEKRWVPIGPEGWGKMADGTVPLAAIYLPARDPDAAETSRERIEPRDAVLHLLTHSFSARRLPARLQADRLSFFSQVVARVPVWTLRYPDGYERLPDVVASLLTGAASPTPL